MPAPVQLRQQLVAASGLRRHDISQMPDLVLQTDSLVPIPDECGVVFNHVGKRPTVEAEDARIAEMGIACEVDHPRYLALRARTSTTCYYASGMGMTLSAAPMSS